MTLRMASSARASRRLNSTTNKVNLCVWSLSTGHKEQQVEKKARYSGRVKIVGKQQHKWRPAPKQAHRSVKIERRDAVSSNPSSSQPMRHVFIAGGKSVLSSSTNRQQQHKPRPVISKKTQSLDTLISNHAKGFSTLVERRLDPKDGKHSRVKQAAIAFAVQQLEENLGTSFNAAIRQPHPAARPWFGM